jgi:hypothetical protein
VLILKENRLQKGRFFLYDFTPELNEALLSDSIARVQADFSANSVRAAFGGGWRDG